MSYAEGNGVGTEYVDADSEITESSMSVPTMTGTSQFHWRY